MPVNEIDDIIVEKFSNGDKNGYGIIYKYYKDIVLSNIGKIVHRQDVAEDILQDVFIKLWENKHKLKDKKSLAAWLFQVSYNCSINHIRLCLKSAAITRDMEQKDLYDPNYLVNSSDALNSYNLKNTLLTEAISLLPPRKRKVFLLCKIHGKTYNETSAIMNIASSTVKEYIVEANRFVRKYILDKYANSAVGIFLCAVMDVL